MARIFLSHSSVDNAHSVGLRDWLESEGWDDVFLDLDPDRGIAAGERWERALNEAAARCEGVLFLVSQAWLQSGSCRKELSLARKLDKRVFGVLIEPIDLTELPAELTGAYQVVDLASGRDHRQFRVTLPRTHEECHVTFSQEGLKRLRLGLVRAELDPRFFEWPPEHDPDRPPYRGLRPLEADDAGIFFGRDAPIFEALDQLRGLRVDEPPRLLVILGASGAGESLVPARRPVRSDDALRPRRSTVADRQAGTRGDLRRQRLAARARMRAEYRGNKPASQQDSSGHRRRRGDAASPSCKPLWTRRHQKRATPTVRQSHRHW